MDCQRHVANSVHKLNYSEPPPVVRKGRTIRGGGRWIPAANGGGTGVGRDPGYLDNFIRPDGQPLRSSIPKIDVALIAHCFQTPLELWEIDDERWPSGDMPFDWWLKVATDGGLVWLGQPGGRDLFSFGGLAIPDTDHPISWEKLGPAPEAALRAAGGVVHRIPTPLPKAPAYQLLRFSMELPAEIQTAQVMLFEDDGDAVALISSAAQTDGSVRCIGGHFRTPRRDDGPAMWFHPCERTELIALIVMADSSLQLDRLSFYQAGDPDVVQILDYEQIADLRRRLFALPPSTWCMVKKVVSFV